MTLLRRCVVTAAVVTLVACGGDADVMLGPGNAVPDDGAVTDTGGRDATSEAGDARATDARVTDARITDARATDALVTDSGLDASRPDVVVPRDATPEGATADVVHPDVDVLPADCPPPVHTITLPGTGPVTFSGTLAATGNIDEYPNCGVFGAEADAGEEEYTLVVTETSRIVIETGGTLDTVLAVRGTCDDDSTQLACDDDTSDSVLARIDATFVPGRYTIIVDALGLFGRGAYTLTARAITSAPDATCATAVPLVIGTPVTGQSLEGGGSPPTGTRCGAASGNARYYAVSLPPGTITTVAATRSAGTTTGTATLSELATCAATACDATAAWGGASARLTVANSDTTARDVVVAVASSSNGAFDVAATTVPIPAGAVCTAPVALASGATLTAQTTVGAYATASCNGATASGEVFYSLVVAAGHAASITATPTGTPLIRPVLHVSDTCASTTCLVQATAPATGPASVSFANTGTTDRTLLVSVASNNATTGSFDLATTDAEIPADAVCTTPSALASGTMTSTNTVAAVTRTAPCGGSLGAQTYFSITVPVGQRLDVTATTSDGSTTTPVVRAFASCTATACLGRSTATTGTSATASYSNRTIADVDVIVSVASSGANSSGAVFDLTTSVAPFPTYTRETLDEPAGGGCDDLSTTTIVQTLTRADGTAFTDDSASAIARLPFAMTYWGRTVMQYSVASNGFLQLWAGPSGTPSSSLADAALPVASIPGQVAPYWTDLVVGSPTSIKAAVFGPLPFRHVTVQWAGWRLLGAATSNVTFQAQLYETTNVIEMHYCTLTGPNTAGQAATIGISDLDALLASSPGRRQPALVSTTQFYRFTPVTP